MNKKYEYFINIQEYRVRTSALVYTVYLRYVMYKIHKVYVSSFFIDHYWKFSLYFTILVTFHLVGTSRLFFSLWLR